MNTQLQNVVQKVLGSHIRFGERHPYRTTYGSGYCMLSRMWRCLIGNGSWHLSGQFQTWISTIFLNFHMTDLKLLSA